MLWQLCPWSCRREPGALLPQAVGASTGHIQNGFARKRELGYMVTFSAREPEGFSGGLGEGTKEPCPFFLLQANQSISDPLRLRRAVSVVAASSHDLVHLLWALHVPA